MLDSGTNDDDDDEYYFNSKNYNFFHFAKNVIDKTLKSSIRTTSEKQVNRTKFQQKETSQQKIYKVGYKLRVCLY